MLELRPRISTRGCRSPGKSSPHVGARALQPPAVLSIYTATRDTSPFPIHLPACASSSSAASCRSYSFAHLQSVFPFRLRPPWRHCIARCTFVTPVCPPLRSLAHPATCRPRALVGRFWPPLLPRPRNRPATPPDLLTHFCHLFIHCIAALAAARCTIGLCLSTSNASRHGKQTLRLLPCVRAKLLRRQQQDYRLFLRRSVLFGRPLSVDASELPGISPWSSVVIEDSHALATA